MAGKWDAREGRAESERGRYTDEKRRNNRMGGANIRYSSSIGPGNTVSATPPQ